MFFMADMMQKVIVKNLTYTYKNISNTIVAYDKLSGKDLSLIILEIKEVDGEIIVNTIRDNDMWS